MDFFYLFFCKTYQFLGAGLGFFGQAVYSRVAVAAIAISILTLVLLMIKYFRPKDLGKGKIGDVKIEYGKSYIYTKKDMNKAIDVILNAFEEGYADCELYNIRYDSDNSDSDEILKWMNELADAQKLDIGFTQSIKFYSDFNTTSGFKNESGLEANEEYKDWQWYLARSGKGNWYLLTWGYV